MSESKSPKAKRPPERAPLRLELSAVGVVPGDARNVRPGDANIGQFAVAELSEFPQAGVVAPPRAEEVDDCNQHVYRLSARPDAGQFASRALNKVPWCTALGAMLRCSYAKYAWNKRLILKRNSTIWAPRRGRRPPVDS